MIIYIIYKFLVNSLLQEIPIANARRNAMSLHVSTPAKVSCLIMFAITFKKSTYRLNGVAVMIQLQSAQMLLHMLVPNYLLVAAAVAVQTQNLNCKYFFSFCCTCDHM